MNKTGNFFLLKNLEDFRKMNNQNKLNENAAAHKYGCAMIFFDMPEIEELHSKIEDRDVFIDREDPSFGLEHEPHITLLYGIHSDEVEDEKVMNLLESFVKRITEVKISDISKFENPKYDVLKFKSTQSILHKFNKELCDKLPYSTDYPDYNPHLTVSYLKPKMGNKYIELFKGLNYTLRPSKFVYSKPDGSKLNQSI